MAGSEKAAASRVSRAMASGLLFSMPMKMFFTPRIRAAMATPSRIMRGLSSMRRWSAVRHGSHSTPLMIRVSMDLPGGMESFTGVGKAAPPMPTMPASATRWRRMAGSAFLQSARGGIGSAALSSPSASMTTQGSWVPAGPRHMPRLFTLPEVGEWT